MNTNIGDRIFQDKPRRAGKVSRKSAKGRRKICGGKNTTTHQEMR